MTARERALSEWLADVHDFEPTDDPAVDRWRACVTQYMRDGFDWGPATRYRGDGTYAWCGAFAAYCHPHLPVDQRRSMASTWRLHNRWGKDPKVVVALGSVLPGDVVCVGQGDYGSHVTLALGWGDERRSELVTVSGNGEGTLGDGSWGEGVVLRAYPRTALRAAYRLAPR